MYRSYFKENACNGLPSCRLVTLPMKPQLCFDFCRQNETAKFFGLQGGKCYCEPFFHAKSLGGEGVCDFACEGNQKEMCGGKEKVSLFEMHMCGNSGDEATQGLEKAEAVAAEASAAVSAAKQTAAKAVVMAKAWPELGVCSVEPEGKRICGSGSKWIGMASEITDSVKAVQHAGDVLSSEVEELGELSAAATGEQAQNATLMGSLEKTTLAVRDASASAKGKMQVLDMTMNSVSGPLKKEGLKDMASFKALGETEKGWHALCGLEPIEGASWFAETEGDDPSPCAKKCLLTMSGTNGCAGFNYQYKDGLAACQLFSAKGLVKPSIAKAVPIFEISTSKRDAMGFSSIGCYTHGAFMSAGGGVTTHVVREITA